jgi:tetratricopeptide (TPR) repeat protein
MSNELYSLLDAAPSATTKELRKAYFRALRVHTAEKDPVRHQELRQAYAVLGEPESRKEYDSQQGGGGEVGRLLDAGNADLAKEDLANAERNFKRALALAPESVVAKTQLARTAFRREDYSKALRLYGELANSNPDSLEVQVENGWLHLARVIDSTSNSPGSMGSEQKRMLVAARSSFDRCIAVEPSNRAGYVGRGKIEYYREDFAAAERWGRKAIDCDDVRDFEDFDSLHFVMECCVLQNKLDDAVRVIAEVRDLVPQQDEVRVYAAERLAQVGFRLMEVKAFGAAVAVLKACAAIAPDHEGIAELVSANLHASEAHEELDRLKSDPSIPEPVWGLALWGVGTFTDEFESERVQDELFQNVLAGLDMVPPATLRSALIRIQQRYSNVWNTQEKVFGQVLDLAKESSRQQNQMVRHHQQQQQGCFGAETEVVVPRGSAPIATVQVGDTVLGLDPGRGPVWCTVRRVRRVRRPLLILETTRARVRVTSGHLIHLTDSRLVPAGRLRTGDTLALAGQDGIGGSAVVLSLAGDSAGPDDCFNIYLDRAASFVLSGGLCTSSYGWMPAARAALLRVRVAVLRAFDIWSRPCRANGDTPRPRVCSPQVGGDSAQSRFRGGRRYPVGAVRHVCRGRSAAAALDQAGPWSGHRVAEMSTATLPSPP